MNNPLTAALVQQIIARNALAAQTQRQVLGQQQPPVVQGLPPQLSQAAQLQQLQCGVQQLQQPAPNLPLQHLIQSLNSLRSHQIQESYSFLNSDSFHAPPPQHLQPPPGCLGPRQSGRSSISPPATTSVQPVHRLSTSTSTVPQDTETRKNTNSRNDNQESDVEVDRKIDQSSRHLAIQRHLPVSSTTTVRTDRASSSSRTPSPATSGNSAENSSSQMNNNSTYTTSDNSSYVVSNNSYNTSNSCYGPDRYSTGNNTYSTSNNYSTCNCNSYTTNESSYSTNNSSHTTSNSDSYTTSQNSYNTSDNSYSSSQNSYSASKTSYTVSNNNNYTADNQKSYGTTNYSSTSNRGMKRQYDDYYEQWDDPSPAKRSRDDNSNHRPVTSARPVQQRNNLVPVNVNRVHYQNNRDVKDPRPIEDVKAPPPHVSANQDQKVTNHIWQHFLDKQQTQDAYQKKMRLREALYTVTKGIFPYCGLYMVGSSMSGFGSVYSDLDMCLMLSHKAIDQKKEATDILMLLLKSLKKCSFIKQMELIRARVPILKFRDKIANVECDLNVNNSVGIRNTHLLGAYSRMDWRVRPLVLFTKHWAQFHDINDARKMTISSYSLSMMVLHYLQYGCDPPVLPSLHKIEPEKYNSDRDIRTLSLAEELPDFQTKNKDSLAELFLGFLEYYARRFNFENDVISIRHGTKLPKRIVARQSYQGPPTQWKFLCIEEPFDLSNTSRSVYDEYTFMRILQVFRVSHRRLSTTRDIMSLFDHPF